MNAPLNEKFRLPATSVAAYLHVTETKSIGSDAVKVTACQCRCSEIHELLERHRFTASQSSANAARSAGHTAPGSRPSANR